MNQKKMNMLSEEMKMMMKEIILEENKNKEEKILY
jgi:hypothetical protein